MWTLRTGDACGAHRSSKTHAMRSGAAVRVGDDAAPLPCARGPDRACFCRSKPIQNGPKPIQIASKRAETVRNSPENVVR